MSELRSGIITLLTDFGLSDPFVGIMKGVILSRFRGASVVDLCHGIPPQSVADAAEPNRLGVADLGVLADGEHVVAVLLAVVLGLGAEQVLGCGAAGQHEQDCTQAPQQPERTAACACEQARDGCATGHEITPESATKLARPAMTTTPAEKRGAGPACFAT